MCRSTASADALGYGVSVIIVNLLLNVVLVGFVPVVRARLVPTCAMGGAALQRSAAAHLQRTTPRVERARLAS